MSALLDSFLALLMRGLTADPQERRNIFWRTLAMLFTGAAAGLSGGELSAGLYTRIGFRMAQMGQLAFVGQISSAFWLLALMGLADRIGNRIRVYTLCASALVVFPLITSALLLCGVPVLAMLGAMMACGVVANCLSALPIMLDYPVLVRTVTPEVRGRMFAILGAACGVLPVITGVISAQALKHLRYPLGYVCCFSAAAVMSALRAASFSVQEELPSLAIAGASRSALPFKAIVDVLRMREFQMLAGPHVLRGLTISIVGFAVPQGLKLGILPPEYPAYATSASWTAAVLGGIALGFIADRWGAGPSTLLADVIYGLAMAVALLSHNPLLFLLFYFVLQFGQNIEASSVPFGCTIIVPPQLMGAFSSARLMVLMGSGAVGSLTFGYLFDRCNPLLIFGIGAALKLLNGLWFWFVFRPRRTAPDTLRDVRPA